MKKSIATSYWSAKKTEIKFAPPGTPLSINSRSWPQVIYVLLITYHYSFDNISYK